MKTGLRSIIILAVFFIFSNSAWVTLRVIKPALIDPGAHIQRIVLLNRAHTEQTWGNVIEGGLTGETIGQDANGLRLVIDGVYDVMAGSERYRVKRATEVLKGSDTGKSFPTPLTWQQVEKYCDRYQVDALLAVELFDSDFIITKGHKLKTHKDDNGNEIKVKEFYAQGVAAVNIGFRLYDPVNRTIADEYHYNKKSDWNANGSSLDAALASLINRRDAVNQTAGNAGVIYAKRITPTWYNVTRHFYNKPKREKDLIRGVRMSEVADWQGAIEAWKLLVDKDVKDKWRGRAAFNIAVGYEVLGDLDTAIEWASDAYTRFGEKKANDYVRELKRRRTNESIAREQLSQ